VVVESTTNYYASSDRETRHMSAQSRRSAATIMCDCLSLYSKLDEATRSLWSNLDR